MIVNKPYVKTLNFLGEYYLFDVNMNSIVQISKEVFDFLNSSLDESNICDKTKYELEQLKIRGMLCGNPIISIEHPATKYISSYLNHCSSLTLQTTQLCNFKCRYCSYASFTDMNRSHSNEQMSIETAKASIDFLYNHSLEEDNINICFYGGEPLLNYKLLQESVEYAERMFFGRNINYLVTTNGSILNDDIIELFNKYNFFVTISLDGPEMFHNKNRKFSMDGKDTYSKVYSNILQLKNKIVDYKNKLQINAVIDPEEDLQSYYSYFFNNVEINDISVKFNLIDSSKLKYSILPDEKFTSTDKLITNNI